MATSKKKKGTHHTIKPGDTVTVAPEVAEILQPEGKRQGVVLRPSVIEALLVADSGKNHSAVTDVCNQIREIAEKQGYTQF